MSRVRRCKAYETGKRICRKCRLELPIEAFHEKRHVLVDGTVSRFPASNCRLCHDVIVRAWQARNREGIRLYQKAWALECRDRRVEQKRQQRQRRREDFRVLDRAHRFKRKAAGGYNRTLKSVKEAVAQTFDLYRIGDKYLDAYSGELIEKPTIDHIVPLSAGGTNDADNMCVTSASNNGSKHAHGLLWWLVKRRTAA